MLPKKSKNLFGDATKDRDIVGEKVTKERTIFRKSDSKKHKKRSRHQFFDIDERDDALVVYIHRDETNFIKTPTRASSSSSSFVMSSRTPPPPTTTTTKRNEECSSGTNTHATNLRSICSPSHDPSYRFFVETRKRPRTDLPSRWA